MGFSSAIEAPILGLVDDPSSMTTTFQSDDGCDYQGRWWSYGIYSNFNQSASIVAIDVVSLGDELIARKSARWNLVSGAEVPDFGRTFCFQ